MYAYLTTVALSDTGPTCENITCRAATACLCHVFVLAAADGGHPTDPALITDLTLERMHIRRLQQLISLVSLRRAK